MKKIFLSLLLLLASTGAIFAQSSLLATLSHEGEITVFYGANALKEAHSAAQHGDAITLSSGSFNAVNITKAITLRGAGMAIDTLKNTYPTIINGSFSIIISDSISKQLTVEGIYNNYVITISNGLNNATFIKNRLKTIQHETAKGDTKQYKNNRFIHCKIVEHFWGPQYTSSASMSFSNCYIRSINNNYCNSIFTNCIIYNDATYHSHSSSLYYSSLNESLQNCTLYNCIFLGAPNTGSYSYNVLHTTSQAYNCIATNIHPYNLEGGSSYTFTNITNNTNKAIRSISSVFKSFNGTYTDLQDFELVDNLKTSFKGTDGTQVGIHGGSLPFSPATTNPQITKCNVASRSTADGKLSVDIEVTCGE